MVVGFDLTGNIEMESHRCIRGYPGSITHGLEEQGECQVADQFRGILTATWDKVDWSHHSPSPLIAMTRSSRNAISSDTVTKRTPSLT